MNVNAPNAGVKLLLGMVAGLLSALTLNVGAMAAATDAYPNRPIHFIVPFPPGGPADLLARTVGQQLSASWGQPVVVENRAGAGGNLGMQSGAKSAPDGYTLILAPTGNLTINPSLYRDLPYNPALDFAPVTQLASVANVLVVNPSVPANSVKELIALAKAKPGQLNFVSPGNGSGAHLAGELLKTMAGIDMQHIPYNGMAPAMNSVLGGQAQVFFAGLPNALPQIKAGKVRALAVASPTRVAALPDVPTMAESGLPGFAAVSWYGVVVPAGTPKEIIEKLYVEISKILQTPAVKQTLEAEGAEAIGNTPEQFAAAIKVETEVWAKVVKASGARVD